MPDVIGENQQGTAFWLELKALACWPARVRTPPLKGAFEKGQIPFLKEWTNGKWKGHGFVLLNVAGIFYLLDANSTPELVEKNRQELVEEAIVGVDAIIELLEKL